jgi:hypothetical protein
LLACLGVLELQRTLLVGGDHWYSRVHGAEDSSLCCGIDAVGQLGEAFVQQLPECDPRTGRGWIFDRAEAGDMLVPHSTVNPASFSQTELKSVLSLPEADEHGVVAP